MNCRILLLASMSCSLSGAFARAEDVIMVRSQEKPSKGTIKNESPRGIEITEKKGGKDLVQAIPAEEIADIIYDVASVDVRVNMYQPATQSEKEYNDPDPKKNTKRRGNLVIALKKYGEAHAKVTEKAAKRHLEYKLALLTARLALDDDADLEPAIKRLSDFKIRHPNSWQIAACLQLLGQLQMDARQYKDAEEAYLELAQADVAQDTKHEAELAAILVTIKSGKHEAALKKLQALMKKLPMDSKFQGRARVAQAACLTAAKKNDEAMTLLRDVARQTADKDVKALAYNALGLNLYNSEKIKDARWEFLWVDVVYNQDRAEHAQALYYLSKIFDKLGEKDRAQECRETLLGERAFAGMEWQRRAAKETRP